MMPLKINNRQARQLWLSSQGLATPPTGPLDVMGIIHALGFVQLDTIQVIARAHHHIIWSRNQNYREPMLNLLMAEDRLLFEHFTHDASVLPMEFYPMWRRQFTRMNEQIDRKGWYNSKLNAAGREAIKQRIRAEGPLSTQAFDTKLAGPKQMWSRPPHKLALDYMWYGGELATSHRVGFTKYYDLAERVFPAELRGVEHSEAAQIDWLCRAALERLGIGSISEIQKFWDAVAPKEARDWQQNPETALVPVQVQAADGGWDDAVALPDIRQRLADLKSATSRLRVLNPFDPVIRDRKRLKRLFGFEYTNEMFVPKAKRKWGYYVYPLLEGDRFVGRIEAKANRANDELNVLNIWSEPGVKWTRQRSAKLEVEIDRLARFVSVTKVNLQRDPTPRPE